TFLCLGRERMAQAEGTDLLRQIEFVAVRDRAHGLGAADEQRSGTRAVTGLARTLLLVELLLRAVHFGARQNLVLARTALRKLPHDYALNEIGARFETENGVFQFDVGRLVGAEREDFRFHLTPPFRLQAPLVRPQVLQPWRTSSPMRASGLPSGARA